jgi:hypothetical protein
MSIELKYNLGIAPDPRTPEEKAKDFQHEELAGSILIEWKEKDVTEWKSFWPREQDGSLSCCGQASAKAVEIATGVVMSAHPIYRSRKNYPEGGMWLQDVGAIWKTIGSTTEEKDHSQFKGESEMNKPITVPTPDKMASYVMVTNPKDIDSIAEAIELHGHCIMIVHCSKSEWNDVPTYNGTPVDFGHCVCGVDYFLKDGKKVILIEDSTGHLNSLKPKSTGQRLITEAFLKKRFDGAMYLIQSVPPPPAYHHHFSKTLKFGMTDPEVQYLQEALKHEGLFPAATPSTKKFLQITKKGVIDFQKKYNLTADGIVGANTNKKLNDLFDNK